MEDNVFTQANPIGLMEPVEEEQLIRITLEVAIYDQTELQRLAQRLKKFLANNQVTQQVINDVLVMSFAPEKWSNNNPAGLPMNNQTVSGDTHMDAPPPDVPFSPTDYVGIEIENMPAVIVDSDRHLEMIEQRVFQKQRVIHMNVIDTTLRITFGVPADSKAIEKVARELKRFLSNMNISITQINDIIIAPHTSETWEMPVPDMEANDQMELAPELQGSNVVGNPGSGSFTGDKDLKLRTVNSWSKYLRAYTKKLYDNNPNSTLDMDSACLVLGQLRNVSSTSIQSRGDPGLKYLVGKTFAEVDNVFSHTTLLIARALFGFSSRAPSRRESYFQ